VFRELWLATPIDRSIAMLGQDPESPYPMDFVLDMFRELSKHVTNTKLFSYSGKTHEQVRATNKTFFEATATAEKK
jgi:hypothetical protein